MNRISLETRLGQTTLPCSKTLLLANLTLEEYCAHLEALTGGTGELRRGIAADMEHFGVAMTTTLCDALGVVADSQDDRADEIIFELIIAPFALMRSAEHNRKELREDVQPVCSDGDGERQSSYHAG